MAEWRSRTGVRYLDCHYDGPRALAEVVMDRDSDTFLRAWSIPEHNNSPADLTDLVGDLVVEMQANAALDRAHDSAGCGMQRP